MLLLSIFVCVLLVPLAYSILEIIFGRFAKQDTVYFVCAFIAILVSLLYTYWHKDRVNSDEVIFFMRNRMVKQRRKFNHLIALNAILVSQVGNYDLELSIKRYRDLLKKQSHSQYQDFTQANTSSGPSQAQRQNQSKSQGHAQAEEHSKSQGYGYNEEQNHAHGHSATKGNEHRADKKDKHGADTNKNAEQNTEAQPNAETQQNGEGRVKPEEDGKAQGDEAKRGLAISALRDKREYEPILTKAMAHKRFRGKDDFDDKARELAYSEALSFIESLLSSVGANDKELSNIGKIYIATLWDKPKLEYELNYVRKISKRSGPYLCELIFVLIIRNMMNVSPFKLGYIDYRVLLEHPSIKKVGAMLLNVKKEQINANYYNRYFFLLNQEQARIKQKWLNEQSASSAFDQDPSGSSSNSQDGPYGHANSGKSSRDNGKQSFDGAWQGKGSRERDDGFTEQYSYSYSQQHGFSDSFNSGFKSNQGSNHGQSQSSSQGHGQGANHGQGQSQGQGYSNGQAHSHSQGQYSRYSSQSGSNTGFSSGASGGGQRFLSKLEKAYITLGLDKSASIEQVKKQYRKLAFKYHPDHISEYESLSDTQKQELNAQFLAIVQAYEIILKDIR